MLFIFIFSINQGHRSGSESNLPDVQLGRRVQLVVSMARTGLQIYGGPGSLSHDFKIWPITFQGSGPSGPILFSCEKIAL